MRAIKRLAVSLCFVAGLVIWSSAIAMAAPPDNGADLSEAQKQAKLAWHKDVDAYINQQRLKFSSYFRKAMMDAGDQPRENTVVVSYVADRSGTITSASVLRTSGFPSLDEAARNFIEMSSPLPTAPAGITTDDETFSIDLVFVSPNAIKNLQHQRMGGDQ